MGSVNKVILVGNLGRDAEFATTSSGTAVARFSVATTSRARSPQSEKWEDRTEWHRVVLFGRQAESLHDYLKKGTLVAIDGRLQTRSWEDKKDGTKRYTTEVVTERLELIGGRPGASRQAASRDDYGDEGGEPAASAPQGAAGDDDIPF